MLRCTYTAYLVFSHSHDVAELHSALFFRVYWWMFTSVQISLAAPATIIMQGTVTVLLQKHFCRLYSVCLQTPSAYLLRRSAKGVSPHAERSAPWRKARTNSLPHSQSRATTFIISKSHNSCHVVTSSSFLLPSAFSRGFRNFTQSL